MAWDRARQSSSLFLLESSQDDAVNPDIPDARRSPLVAPNCSPRGVRKLRRTRRRRSGRVRPAAPLGDGPGALMTKAFGWTRTALEVLVFLRGRFLGSLVFTSPEITIGRSPDSMVCLDHTNVSRQHALLRFDGLGCEIEDAGSLSGILVNGRKVTLAGVRPTDEIGIGPFRLRLAMHRSTADLEHGRFSAQGQGRKREGRGSRPPDVPASADPSANAPRSALATADGPATSPGTDGPASSALAAAPAPAPPSSPSAPAGAVASARSRVVRNLPKPLSSGKSVPVPPASSARGARPAGVVRSSLQSSATETLFTTRDPSSVESPPADGASTDRTESIRPRTPSPSAEPRS